MKEAENDTVRDAGMLAAAQAVEHYEITCHGTLKSWAMGIVIGWLIAVTV